MKKIITNTLILSGVLVLTSCAPSTIIYPTEGNTYTAIATGNSDKYALQETIKDATETCKKQNKSFVVVSQKTRYQGMDPNLKKMANMASDAAFFNSGAFVPTTSLSSNDDYKVIMVFRCQ